MAAEELAQQIEKGTLHLNAFSNDPAVNTFGLYIGKVEVPVAIIRSVGKNKVRVYRGFGKEVAVQRLNHDGRVLWNFEGTQQTMIVLLEQESGEALDLTLFDGKVERALDATLHDFLMESVTIQVLLMHA